MSKIREFIDNNKMSFRKGKRNTTVTTLVGYAQHLGVSQTELNKELKPEIRKDIFIQQEVDRLWNYCSRNSYKSYWNTSEAKKEYKF